MKKFSSVMVFVGLVMIMASVSLAGSTYDPGIQSEIASQQHRIDQGIASGQLTRGEADVLQDNLNYVKGEEARLKADGRLNSKERGRLKSMLDRTSKMIYNKKHNPVVRVY
jgi:hypothetical protein